MILYLQDDGGTIIFGIDESKNFEICGVYDINDIQKKVILQCKNMEPPVRALYNVIQINGKDILVMEIPSVSYYERPCYYKGKGKYEGSYVRVGDAGLKMTEFEIYSYESDKKRDFADNRVISDEDLVLKDNDLINQFLTNIKNSKPNLSKNVPDEQILELSHIYKKNKPTLTGALLFSKDPQYYFPNLTIICLAYLSEDNSDVRFLDNLKTSGTISDMLEQSLNFVLKNIKKGHLLIKI